jgi:protein-tyrosine phosphatase
VIDLHSHVLPGLDDGVRSLDEALDLARQAAAEGIVGLAATPHVREDYPTTADQMEAGVEELRRAVGEAGIPIEILHGAEVAVDLLSSVSDELERLTLAQSGKYLLLEMPYSGSPVLLEPSIKALLARGVTPILAHPERNPDVQDRPERMRSLVELGALLQVTASSIEGRFGKNVLTAAERLLRLGLVHLLAGDAHGPHLREGGLASAASALDDPALARYLTVEVPTAIVAGEELAPLRRRRRLHFRRRH